MSLTKEDVLFGCYRWQTEEPHSDNIETMSDFLNIEISEESGFNVVFVDGTYAEIQDIDDGNIYASHASGCGDFYNHKIDFELI